MKSRACMLYIVLSVIIVALFVADMATGSTPLSLSQVWAGIMGDADAATVTIVRSLRLTKAIAAMLVGAALAVSGLQMQTLFRNPLAGPYVLGITSGSSLGVALFILGAPLLGLSAAGASLGIAGAAWVGAALVLAIVSAVSARIKDIMAILVLGMMLSSGVGALVQVLQYLSHEDALKSFVVWTMGSLGDVTSAQMQLFVPAVLLGLVLAVMAVKPLNLLMLGEQYAVTMGLNVGRSRALIFLSTTLLAGTATAFCGPIGFVGLAVPHVARAIFSNADCKVLLPGSMLTGIAMMLGCDIVSKALALPINSITALLGIPIVIWIVLKSKNLAA